MFDIWSEKLNGGGVRPEYEAGQNIRILESNNCNADYCYVFCSSNNIWYPNTEASFYENIVARDRYEWTNFEIQRAKKLIYVRDIYKSWYVTGINKEVDCIEKLAALIAEQSKGLKLVFVGSSSGGYLATLLGSVLNAEFVVCFSGQMELNNQWAIARNPFLQVYKLKEKYSQYYDLRPFIEQSCTPVYYIIPIQSAQDNYHYQYIKDIPNIKPFSFKSKHHGVVVSKSNLNLLLNKSNEEWNALYEKYSGKQISVFYFSVYMIGFTRAVRASIRETYKKIKRKIKR